MHLHHLPIAALGLMAVSQAQAESFACTFTPDCHGVSPCGPEGPISAALDQQGSDWTLMMQDAPYPVRPVPLAEGKARHFVVAPLDPDAEAVALISIFGDDSAFMTAHGDFLGAVAFTRKGSCTRKAG